MKTLVAIVFATLMLGGANLGFAQSPRNQAPTEEPPQRVAVSPFVYLPSSLPVAPEAAREAVVDGMQAWTETSEDFWLFSTAQLRDRIVSTPGYQDAVALAQLQRGLGIEQYGELNLDGARTRLRAAREQYLRIGHHFVDPVEVSEGLLYEALSLLDGSSGSPSEPLALMKLMVLMSPERQVQPGAFPEEVVAFYRSARSELEGDIGEGGPSEQVARQVAESDLGTDGNPRAKYVLVGNVLGTNTAALQVVVWLYDVEAEQFQLSSTVVVPSPTSQALTEAANRATSQLLSCLVPADPVEEAPIKSSRGENPLALQLNFVYGSFLKFPNVGGQVVEPIGNFGSSIGAAYYMTREFALVIAFQFLNSGTEFSGLVQSGFRTLRGFAGGEIGLGFGRFRASIGALLEGTAVSNITTCPGDEVQERRFCTVSEELPTQFLLGVNARPRLSFSVIDSMQVFVGGGTAFYLFPLGEDSLNFLTNGEIGLQYRF